MIGKPSYLFLTYKVFPILILVLFNKSFQSKQTDEFERITHYYEKGLQCEKVLPDSALYYYQNGLTLIDYYLKNKNVVKVDSTDLYETFYLSRIGKLFHRQNKFSFAGNYLQKALSKAIEINNDSLTADTYFSIGEIYLENGSYDKAINSYKEALIIYIDNDYPEDVFWTNIGLGIVYRECGKTELAKQHYNDAIQFGEEQSDPFFIGVGYNNLGNLYRQIGDYESAIRNLQVAYKNFEEYGQDIFISDCLDSMGQLYFEIHSYDRALEYFKNSTTIAEKAEDKYRLMGCYANLANTYGEMGEKENSLLYFSKTIELAQAVGDKSRLSEVYIKLAKHYQKNNENKNALLHLRKALSISREIGDTVSIASSLNTLSQIYFEDNRLDSAYTYSYSAYTLAKEKKLLKILKESSFTLSKIYETQNNYKQAYNYFRIYEASKDSLLNADKLRILEETEAKFNLERLEKEKLEVESQALRADKEIQMKNVFIAALIIFLLIFIYFTIRFIIKKRKEKISIETKSKNLTKRIDLLKSQLDSRNRELAAKAVIISNNNKVLEEITEGIEDCLDEGKNERDFLKQLKNQLESIYQEKSWDNFLQHFEQVHPDFYKKLMKKYPDLTQNELKICAFLRMNLNTKEISNITRQSVKSVEVARTRIRKKLSLEHNDNLTAIIQNI